eukprot:2805656-Amphidinium_carterae.1
MGQATQVWDGASVTGKLGHHSHYGLFLERCGAVRDYSRRITMHICKPASKVKLPHIIPDKNCIQTCAQLSSSWEILLRLP